MAKEKEGKWKESAEPDTTILPASISANMTHHQPKIIIENYSKVYEYSEIQDFVQNYPKNKYLLIKNSKGDFMEIVEGVFKKLLKEDKIPKLSFIYFEDCASRNEANYLLREFQAHKNKKSKAFFFHNVAGSTYRNGGNIDLLNDLRERVSSGRLPLVIIGLNENVKDSDLPRGFQYYFKVVDLLCTEQQAGVVESVKVEEKVAKGKLSEYLRQGSHSDRPYRFRAKAKGVEGEREVILSENTQEYKLLRLLFNIYGTRNSRASTEDILIACGIQGHEKGEYIDKKKIKHLRKIVSDVRTALQIAGLKRGYLKFEYKKDDKGRVIKDECSLLIHCLPK